jgi:hypothetical protein
MLKFIEKLLNLYYYEGEEVLEFDKNGLPISSIIVYKKIGKLTKDISIKQ